MKTGPVLFPPFVLKHYKWLFHTFLIGTIYVFWISYVFANINSWLAFLKIFLYASTYVTVVYFNIYFLFNKYFLAGKFRQYILSTVLSFLLACLVLHMIYARTWVSFTDSFRHPDFYLELLITGIKCITFTGLGIAYRLLHMWVQGERKIAALANANLVSELENLKNQVSPHFLFNTLNNLYVLIKTKPQLAANAVLELSDLIKYQLYECANERVPLKREIQYIRSLLSLEKLRKDKWHINLQMPDHVPDIYIEPLLFINLIENAIKHGVQQLETGIIDISLQVTPSTLVFSITNSKPQYLAVNTKQGKKIGMANLYRRLELLYPARYSLYINDEHDKYIVTLTLQL